MEARAGQSVDVDGDRGQSANGKRRGDFRCSGGPPLITMVETTDLRKAHDASCFGPLHGPRLGWIFLQRQVTAAPVIILEKSLQMMGQAGAVEDDDVVQTFAANRANDPFHVGPLPRRPWSRQYLFDSHDFHLLYELLAEDPVPIPQEIAGCRLSREGLPELVRRPFCGRVGGDAEVENASAVVRQHQKHVKNLKADRRHREEVDRNHARHVIFQEGSPGLRRWSPAADQVFAHTRFTDLNT